MSDNAETPPSGPHRTSHLFGGVLVGLATGFLLTLLWLSPSEDRFAFLYADFTIANCLTDHGVTDRTPAEADPEVRACYDRLVRQGQLNEFQIRRVNFLTQHIADTVTLWMVVTLTICGVALAGWQIFTSSRLITRNPDALTSELSIESGKIFVRSSVTGLLILIVSFAFFYVYVVWIYQIREWRDDAQVDETAAATASLPPVIWGGELPEATDVPLVLSGPEQP